MKILLFLFKILLYGLGIIVFLFLAFMVIGLLFGSPEESGQSPPPKHSVTETPSPTSSPIASPSASPAVPEPEIVVSPWATITPTSENVPSAGSVYFNASRMGGTARNQRLGSEGTTIAARNFDVNGETIGQVTDLQRSCSSRAQSWLGIGRIYQCSGRIEEMTGTIAIEAADFQEELTSYGVPELEYKLNFRLTITEGEVELEFRSAKNGRTPRSDREFWRQLEGGDRTFENQGVTITQTVTPDRPFEFKGDVIASQRIPGALPVVLTAQGTARGIQHESSLETITPYD